MTAQAGAVVPVTGVGSRLSRDRLWHARTVAGDVDPPGPWRRSATAGRVASATAGRHRGRAGVAAEVGAEAGEQDGEAEGFDEVVVGSAVEAGDDVDVVGACGEDDDQQVGEAGPQGAGGVDAARVGQAEVKDEGVVRGAGGFGLGLPRAQTLDVLEPGQLGALVTRKRPFLFGGSAAGTAELTIGALAKHMALLAAASDTPLHSATGLADTPADPCPTEAHDASPPTELVRQRSRQTSSRGYRPTRYTPPSVQVSVSAPGRAGW